MAHTTTTLRCCRTTVRSSLKPNATIFTPSLLSTSRKTTQASLTRRIHTELHYTSYHSPIGPRSSNKRLYDLHTSTANPLDAARTSGVAAVKGPLEHVVIGSGLRERSVSSESAWSNTISPITTIISAAAMRRTAVGRDKTCNLSFNGVDLRSAFTHQHNQYQSNARSSNQASTRLGIVSRCVSVEEEEVATAMWNTPATGLRRGGRGTLFEPSRGRFGLIGGAMGQPLTRG